MTCEGPYPLLNKNNTTTHKYFFLNPTLQNPALRDLHIARIVKGYNIVITC